MCGRVFLVRTEAFLCQKSFGYLIKGDKIENGDSFCCPGQVESPNLFHYLPVGQ